MHATAKAAAIAVPVATTPSTTEDALQKWSGWDWRNRHACQWGWGVQFKGYAGQGVWR